MLPLLCGLAPLLTPSAASAQSAHPRIFVTPEDLPRLRAMAGDDAENSLGFVPSEAWAAIKAQADTFVDAPPYHYAVDMPGKEGAPSQRWEYTLSDEPPPGHQEYSHYPPWTAMFQERSDTITTRLKVLTLAYVVSEDPVYFTRAREIVLHLCAWDIVWTDATYGSGQPCLDTGHAAQWVGIFYDWCYDSLSPEERETIRRSLVEYALVPIDEMMDSVSPYHNYTAVIAGGLSIGAAALLGEDDRAQGWIDHAVARAKLNFDSQGSDGGAMEGPMYGDYAANSFADMIWALETAGVESDLVEHNYIKTLPRYCISLLNPNNFQQPCFGDGGPAVGFGRLMLILALRGDTDAAWFCEKGGVFNARSPRGFIALDPGKLRPAQPTHNPSDAFVDVGYAILRDGYTPGTGFLAFKAGPPEASVGHNHFDHNSFVINYAGSWVAWDPGYRSYFSPPARKYTVSSFGHNTVVLDLDDAYLEDMGYAIPGHDQRHVNKGRIAEFSTGDSFDYVLGQAAEAYNTDDDRVLDRFDRQIVFVKPNIFLVRDALSAPEEHTYSFMLHLAADGEFRTVNGGIEASSPGGLLQAHVYSPHGITTRSGVFPGAEAYGSYLAATTGRTAETTFTAALVPRQHGELLGNTGFERAMRGWRPRNMEGFRENHVIDEEVSHSGSASARIDNGGYYYSRQFSVPPGTKLNVKFWARCTTAEGASSLLYYWKGKKSFARTAGPVATVDEWTQYEFEDIVPDDTEEVCLALQFFGEGQCWYDDVELTSDLEIPESAPAQVTPLDDGASGLVVEVDGLTHVLLCGEAGTSRTVTVVGYQLSTDAEMAVISRLGDGPSAFVLRGTTLTVDGETLTPAEGTWRVGPVKRGQN